jgi:hypothetical protein
MMGIASPVIDYDPLPERCSEFAFGEVLTGSITNVDDE